MNFRKNNGFTGIDICISMIIILIFIPTTIGTAYNIQKTNASVKRQSRAISIATEVLEIAKSENYVDVTLDYDETTNTYSKFLMDLGKKYNSSNYTNTETQENGYKYIYYQAIGDDGEHYQIQIGLQNYYPNETEKQDLVKKINVTVIYPMGKKLKTININTVIQNT